LDLFKFNDVNLDPLTETYNLSFYFQYLATWPEYFLSVESPDDRVMAYIMGKVEGTKKNWHGHVTAVTVGPEYRRIGLAKKTMDFLEMITQDVHNAYFVDLFVRKSNQIAIDMYTQFGYVVYRRVLQYYSGEEDALDMRKALKRDTKKESMIPLKHPVRPEDLGPDFIN
jgi:N-terminal acetyltransferase B complex catalytic subunit